MSAALHLAQESDLTKLLALVSAFHQEVGISQTEDARQNAITPLLKGSPHGAIWLIGPRRAPVGYIVVSFGWSIEMGGMDGFVDEFFIRPSIRQRGMGTEVLHALLPQLASAGLMALHLEVDKTNHKAQRLYQKLGFAPRDDNYLMTWLANRAIPT